LREANERLSGLPVRALPGLGDIAPTIGGEPRVIGPYDRIHDEELALPAIRTLGYRDPGGWPAPIAHAKLALLGRMCWHDEGPLGHVEDVIGFRVQPLWVSSANFTKNSRRCLEFGYWTEEPALLGAANTFLVQLLGAWEDLDAPADKLTPDRRESSSTTMRWLRRPPSRRGTTRMTSGSTRPNRLKRASPSR
jgi:hypothetical protein